MTKGCKNKSCHDKGQHSACHSCRPDIVGCNSRINTEEEQEAWVQWRIQKLEIVLPMLSHAYYCDGEALVDDDTFDSLFKELQWHDSRNPVLHIVGCSLCYEKDST